MQRGVRQHAAHSCPLPPHSQVTLLDCSRSGIWLKQETSERLWVLSSLTHADTGLGLILFCFFFVFFFNFHFSVHSQAPFHCCFSEIADLFEPINQGGFVEKDEACSHLGLQPGSDSRINSIRSQSLLSNMKVERDTADRHCL